ncbi:hypothetical protein ElyMa_002591900 [Elysia marginata]|uniref:ATP-dependent DNA helicase n=1 Tax=Elysia marginata TaxID=1093978 RepID=A0AAV4H1C7_9GAST|nr:hypothetical protein ElyMa_002591900 [Elysia marginata]
MRVLANGGDSTFPDLLLNLGNGQLQPMTSDPDAISLSEFGNEVRNIDELIESVYHNFEGNHRDAVWLTDRAILTPYNDTVRKINNRLI